MDPDLRYQCGSNGDIYIDLWRGLFRDEVRVWWDVRPALGGLIARRTTWRGRGEALWREAVEAAQAEHATP